MLTTPIENILNRGLPRSPRARQLCAELAGRKVTVEVGGLARVSVESTGESLKLGHAEPGSPADAHIAGGPLSLLALAGSSAQSVLQRGAVTIEGDAELAQKFRELALLLRPDIEEELSVVLGDVPAHQIGRFARAAVRWTRNSAATTVRNFAEYLGHETRDLVPRSEADRFLGGVDELREDVDRLAARLDALPRHPAANRS